jgi:ParB family chromosome partitioning protein
MKTQHIELIPVSQVRIVNPRSRNQFAFRAVINNIEAVGLKKPITVCSRELDDDGTRYDLVCGEGRLKAIIALGGKEIPAIITQATLKERYLMSMIENIARRRPRTSELLGEVRRLREARNTNAAIATTLGLGRTYIDGIVRLLRCDEVRLVEQVETGTIPLKIAIQIATATGKQVQHALNLAYRRGDLRGAKLRAVERIIAARAVRGHVDPQSASKLSGPELLKEYELSTGKQRALVKRAAIVHERLAILTTSMKQLMNDAQFITLLMTERLETMPELLMLRVKERSEARS